MDIGSEFEQWLRYSQQAETYRQEEWEKQEARKRSAWESQPQTKLEVPRLVYVHSNPRKNIAGHWKRKCVRCGYTQVSSQPSPFAEFGAASHICNRDDAQYMIYWPPKRI